MKERAQSNGQAARLGHLGWTRDLPDFRDYTPDTPKVRAVTRESKLLTRSKKASPESVDLREWCSPIEDQGALGSCTANAGVGLIEYFQRRAFNQYLDASRLFLYKVTRDLMGSTGDSGAYLRDTMKAMVLAGVPPERYWPYDIASFDIEPSAFCYSFASNYKSIVYYRLDPAGSPTSDVLSNVRQNLAAGLPSMFGFTVYSTFPPIGEGTGDIPFPQQGDTVLGGHAVDAVGFDDGKRIGGYQGALLIRNSWGTAWGDGGYGWLPYAYVEAGIAVDFWSLVKAEFVDTNFFSEAGDAAGHVAHARRRNTPVHA